MLESKLKITELKMNLVEISLSEIYEDSDMNCRGVIVPRDVLDLVESIKEHGLQQPPTVQPYALKPPFKYRIVTGHRRFTAFKVLEKESIPCIIKDGLTDLQVRILNLQENLERQDLNMVQEAVAIQKFKNAGYTIQETSRLINKSTGWVQVRFNLLAMPIEIQEAAAAKFITQEQVKDLYSLPSNEARFAAVKQIKESKLRGDKKKVKIKETKKNPLAKKRRLNDEIFELQDHIIETIGANFGTRCLAWAAGEISDLELYRDIKEIAEQKGIPYSLPLTG